MTGNIALKHLINLVLPNQVSGKIRQARPMRVDIYRSFGMTSRPGLITLWAGGV